MKYMADNNMVKLSTLSAVKCAKYEIECAIT